MLNAFFFFQSGEDQCPTMKKEVYYKGKVKKRKKSYWLLTKACVVRMQQNYFEIVK